LEECGLSFPEVRLRRFRKKTKMREMVRETILTPNDLIYPIFVKEGISKTEPINAMPGQSKWPLGEVVAQAEEVASLGIPAVILFGIPRVKDEVASSAYAENGIVQEAVRAIKGWLGDNLIVITDICLCEYMSHGHCGIVDKGEVHNDPTLKLLQKMATSLAGAGSDMVAPSGMMDGQVKAIRTALDSKGFRDIPIMAYSSKMASNFYGPFREAAESSPSFGDRKGYQLDFSNPREALRESLFDLKEGADILMVKPALAYLDIIFQIKEAFNLPVAAYSVSGEYSMVKAASLKEWINEQPLVLEILTAIKRAGADMILTYWAKDAARWLD
jgi:porphobilinogen synthase